MEDYAELSNASRNVPLLGRRVNYQPLFGTHPKVRSYPLSELSTPDQRRTQEALVVRDLLNVLVGLEGVYIRYNNHYDPHSDVVPEFKIAKTMDRSLKSFSKRIAKLGKYYIVLTKVAEKWSEPSFGNILHRFGFEIKRFLRLNYLHFIADRLERDFRESTTFSISELEQVVTDVEITKQLELLYTVSERIDTEDRTRRNMDRVKEDFNNFINDLKDQGQSSNAFILATDTRVLPIAKGGIILRIIQEMVHENLGDRTNVAFLNNILNNVAGNYCEMLFNWLTEGKLNDPYDEFMVIDTMKNVNDITPHMKYGDRLWDTQFVIRKDGLLKQFDSQADSELLFMVLTTGKLVNLVKTSTNKVNLTLATGRNDEIKNFSELMEGSTLELYINKWYNEANRLCLKMYLEGYQLIELIKQLQKHYFGYHNANGVARFLQKNMVELTRRHRRNGYEREKLQRSFEIEKESKYFSNDDLISQLLNLQLDNQPFGEVILQYVRQEEGDGEQRNEMANSSEDDGTRLLRANNFQNLKDILLQELNTAQDGHEDPKALKSNIYYLNFEMIVPYPISIIITRPCIAQYQIISRYLFLLQYYSKLLDDTWIEINKNFVWKYRNFPAIVRQRVVKRTRVLHNQMNQFVKLLLECFTQNVVETEMSTLTNNAVKKTSILDWQLLSQECLTNIMTNCCLSQLIEIQLQLFEIVHKFCKFITSMRREFCQLDPKLYELYIRASGRQQNLPKNVYSQEESSTRVSEYIEYIEMVAQGFQQHVVAFKEGLIHHSSSNRSRDANGDDNHNAARLLYSLSG